MFNLISIVFVGMLTLFLVILLPNTTDPTILLLISILYGIYVMIISLIITKAWGGVIADQIADLESIELYPKHIAILNSHHTQYTTDTKETLLTWSDAVVHPTSNTMMEFHQQNLNTYHDNCRDHLRQLTELEMQNNNTIHKILARQKNWIAWGLTIPKRLKYQLTEENKT